MRRIRIVKDYKQYRKGDVVTVTPNIAFGLIDKGVAVVSKEMTALDTHTTSGADNNQFKPHKPRFKLKEN